MMNIKLQPKQERFAKIIVRYEKLRSQQREAERHPLKTGAPFRALVAGVEGAVCFNMAS